MFLGIDVGGTNTDGALLDHNYDLVATAKIPTQADHILPTIKEVLARLLQKTDPAQAERLVISTTLGLNAILTGRADPVGVLATGGPGLPPDFTLGEQDRRLFKNLPGQENHLGEIINPLAYDQALTTARQLAGAGAGAQAFVAISKFGPKNPALEQIMAEAVAQAVPAAPLTLASRLCGQLNFPRRLHTAVYNSATLKLYQRFTQELGQATQEMGLTCPIWFLTADGGALPLADAAHRPVLTLAAGPAAGLLGLWALTDLSGDSLMVDIGGTTTDLGLIVEGEPLLTSEGLEINGRPTLVRSFLTLSVPFGGDLTLARRPDSSVTITSNRQGGPLALAPEEVGRRPPTVTDALNVLGLARFGRVEASFQALATLTDQPPEESAAQVLTQAQEIIKTAAHDFVSQVNTRPVYTVEAIELGRKIKPTRAALLGGPAEALAGAVSEALELPVSVPAHSQVANAVGAARSRPTLAAELYADTALGRMTIPALGLAQKIDRGYNRKKAEADLLAALAQVLASRPEAGPPQIIEAEVFKQVTDYGQNSQIIRLRAQAAAGILGFKTRGGNS